MSEDEMTQMAHAPYLTAMGAALTASGLIVTEVVANPDDPMNGAITIDVAGHAPLVLGWTEESGWYRGWEGDHGVLRNLHDSPLDLLATSSELVQWVHAVVNGSSTDTPLVGHGAVFRYSDDDDGFLDRLRTAGGVS